MVQDRREIERYFFDYPKNFMQSAEDIEELAYQNIAVDFAKIAVQTTPGTSDKIENFIDKAQKRYCQCRVVEKVMDSYIITPIKRKFIDVFYFKRTSINKTMEHCNISRRTLYYWRDEIYIIALQWARFFNLVTEK